MKRIVNPAVGWLLRSPLHDLLSAHTMLLRWTGRRTGRTYATPVNYARRGDAITVVSRDRRVWWRNLRAPTPVSVWLDGREHRAVAQAFPGDRARAGEALRRIFTAVGRRLTPEDAARRAKSTVAVEIELRGPAGPAPAPLRGAALWRAWIVAMATGELLGFLTPALVGALVGASGAAGAIALPCLVLAGTVEGAVLGLAQAHALRRALPAVRTVTWVRATAIAAAVAWTIGMLPSTFADQLEDASAGLVLGLAVPLGAGLLLVMGVLQWRVLRNHVARAWRWIPATALAWAIGLAAGGAVMSLWQEDQAIGLVVLIGITGAVVMGVTVAAVSGGALVRMLHTPAVAGRAVVDRRGAPA